MQTKPNFVELGTVIRSHGLDGSLVIQTSADAESALSYLECVYIDDQGVFRKFEIVESSWMPRGWKVSFEGLSDINSTQKFLKKKLYAARSDLRGLMENSYYIHDLVGRRVVAPEMAGFHGVLKSVESLPLQDVWWVDVNGRVIGIPAVARFIECVSDEEIRVRNVLELQ